MNPLAATLSALVSTFERLNVGYVIGGSLASSVRGVVRLTYDIDIGAAVSILDAERLGRDLGREWYADPGQIREAIETGRAFNLIHIPLGNKVDVFPASEDFHRRQLERATRVRIPLLDDHTEYRVATAEDILLAKLRWYADGGEVSERQWKDISGLVAANSTLDSVYLETWARELGVTRLLVRALGTLRH